MTLETPRTRLSFFFHEGVPHISVELSISDVFCLGRLRLSKGWSTIKMSESVDRESREKIERC